jgi:MFS family permease
MFVLRIFSSGPLVRALTPIGLLLVCAIMAAGGLYFLANAGTSAAMVFMAATLYGVGKTFFWPTTLGIVSEQFPKGGALTLNGMGGMGMIAVGVLGAPFLGAVVDQNLDTALKTSNPAIHAQVAETPRSFPLIRGLDSGLTSVGPYQPLDKNKLAALPEADKVPTDATLATTRQHSLAEFAILPIIMAVCYLLLFVYFQSQGGYKAVNIGGGH